MLPDRRGSDPAAPPSPGTVRHASRRNRTGRRRAWRAAGWVASAALFGLAVLALRDRWGSLDSAGGLPGVLPSAAAVVLSLLANALLADTWRRVVAVGGVQLPGRTAAGIWSISQLARYALGSAQVAGRAAVGRRYGVTVTSGVLSTLVEIGWQTSLTALLAVATLPWWLPAAGSLRWLVWVAAVGIVALLAGLAFPQSFLRLLARVVRLLRRGSGGAVPPLARRQAFELTARYAANLALRTGAFLVLFGAVGGDLPGQATVALGAYAAGQLVGRLAVFAPGGLGPREGVTALIVGPVLGAGPALVLVAATRVLELLAELAFFGLARAGMPRAQPAPPPA